MCEIELTIQIVLNDMTEKLSSAESAFQPVFSSSASKHFGAYKMTSDAS